MNRFNDTLRRTSDRLDLPQPARCHVLLEIAADMEDLFAALQARGLDEESARRQAIEDTDLSEESLRELTRVHAGPVRRVLDRLSDRALQRWERILLVAVVALTLYAAGGWAVGGQLFRDSGPVAWPVLAAALGVFVTAASKFYQLFLKQDHAWRRLHRGLGSVLGLSVLIMFLGFAGTWLEVFRLAGEAAGSDQHVMFFMMRWALRSTALLQLSLGLALLGGLAWFGLAGKVNRIARDEAALLLETS
ncbi:MAG: hypothetical protein GY838_20075 [bacterium]|nr:hypothetical protein [bacterium]